VTCLLERGAMIPESLRDASTFADGPRLSIACAPMRWTLSMPLWCLLGAGCTWFNGQNPVLITSDPPGARIWIDGRDTGRTTPANFDIAGNFGLDHDVRLTKKGYQPAERRLYQHTEGYTSRWIDGASTIGLPPLPIFWTPGDFVFPFGVHGQIVPDELHVKLYKEGEPLLGFDLLRQRAAGTTTPPPATAASATTPAATTPPVQGK
jgi:hypothetical protein